MEHSLLHKAGRLLLKYGPKSVSMDDIAAHLGISKKTIYKEFANKQEILERITAQTISQFQADFELLHQRAENAVEETLLQTSSLTRLTELVKTSFASEMSKYFCDSWRQIELDWLKMLADITRRNLQRGIEEGLYRTDIDMEFCTRLRLNHIQFVLNGNPAVSLPFDARTNLLKLTEFYLQALCTEQGRTAIAALAEKYL